MIVTKTGQSGLRNWGEEKQNQYNTVCKNLKCYALKECILKCDIRSYNFKWRIGICADQWLHKTMTQHLAVGLLNERAREIVLVKNHAMFNKKHFERCQSSHRFLSRT